MPAITFSNVTSIARTTTAKMTEATISLPAEAAVGAQGHIDHVHVQQQGVVQGRQDGIRGGAVGGVGE